MNKVLESTKFGKNDKEYGMSKLIRLDILETGYPLHDGPVVEDATNDRAVSFPLI